MTQPLSPAEQKIADISLSSGIGIGLVCTALVWLIMVILCNFVFNMKGFTADAVGAIAMGTIFGGLAFGTGCGFTTASIVRFRIEMAFARESSLSRYLKNSP